jgi:putative CocE/NonD family hydrolase
VQRSPYGFEGADEMLDLKWRQLAEEQFIFVLEDLRGRYLSEGEFQMLRPLHGKDDPQGTDESTDAYDTIDWLIKNVERNNGKAGVWGVSYGGVTTMMALAMPHPALMAVSEQASSADQFLGDDFHHNGAFRLRYGFEYSAAMEANGRTVEPPKIGSKDSYTFYLEQLPLANMDVRVLGSSRPTWRQFVEHPSYDEYWRRRAMLSEVPANNSVPNLNVAGWWDQEDFYGPLTIYAHHEKGDRTNKNFLVVGPWNHGGWSDDGNAGRQLGPLDFGSDTALYFRKEIEAPWFAYWLKGKGRLRQPEALVFQTGRNVWRQFSNWPPTTNVVRRKMYLAVGGELTFTPPSSSMARVARKFLSDPSDPVPYRPRPIALSRDDEGWGEWLTNDQKFVEGRPDVLTWISAPLTQDLAVSGEIKANLVASTTGTDADWVVKMIDVYPEESEVPAKLRGYRLMIASEVMRGRFRDSFSQPAPLPANRAVAYTIGLNSASHVFLSGHRVMVQVQSSWFPLIDRNPQKYLANPFYATKADLQKAVHRVLASSNIELPIEEN